MTSRLEEAEHKAQSLQTGTVAAYTKTGYTHHPHVVLNVNVSCFQDGGKLIPLIFGFVVVLETNRCQFTFANCLMNCILNTVRHGQS